MGRPRKPTNVLLLKGAFSKDPARGRERENELPVIGDVGEPPEALSPEAQGCWREIKGSLPEGTLGKSDAITLELASGLLADIRAAGIRNTPPAILARMQALLGSMGMTPADRSKVKVPPKAAVNPFEDLDQQQAG